MGDETVEIPRTMKPAIGISANECYAALHADGTVTFLGNTSRYPDNLRDVAKVCVGHGRSGAALHKDGSVTYWQTPETDSATRFTPDAGWITDAKDIAVGEATFFVLKDDGTVVAWNRESEVSGVAKARDIISLHTTFGGGVVLLDQEGRAFRSHGNHYSQIGFTGSPTFVRAKNGHQIYAAQDESGVWHVSPGGGAEQIRAQFAAWRNSKVLKDLAIMVDKPQNWELLAWIE